MAAEGFTVAHQQPIGAGQSLPIAEAEGTPAGAEGEQARHGVPVPVAILQLPAQQQQAAAFGHDRQTGAGSGREGSQAAAAGRQLGGMQFRIAPRQDHSPTARRQGLIGQGTPGLSVQAHGPQQFRF
jgi:hypothetical protein